MENFLIFERQVRLSCWFSQSEAEQDSSGCKLIEKSQWSTRTISMLLSDFCRRMMLVTSLMFSMFFSFWTMLPQDIFSWLDIIRRTQKSKWFKNALRDSLLIEKLWEIKSKAHCCKLLIMNPEFGHFRMNQNKMLNVNKIRSAYLNYMHINYVKNQWL